MDLTQKQRPHGLTTLWGLLGGVTKSFCAPKGDPRLGVHFLGRSNPSGDHVLTQATTCSSSQDTLENFSGQQGMSTEKPPDKKHKNFHYSEGVSSGTTG